MPVIRLALEGIASGLLVALLAPPVAAISFLLASAVWSTNTGKTYDSSASSVLLLLLGVTTGAYILGAVPAFLAGVALPTLRRVLSPILAAAATGLLGVLAYSLTFGSHLMSGPIESTLIYTLPALTGVTVAALLALRIERRHTEA